MSDERIEIDECQRALARVYAFHDGELSEDEMDEIRQHLMACEPCLDHFEVEEALRLIIKRCCGNEHAPRALRCRIETSLSSVSWR